MRDLLDEHGSATLITLASRRAATRFLRNVQTGVIVDPRCGCGGSSDRGCRCRRAGG